MMRLPSWWLIWRYWLGSLDERDQGGLANMTSPVGPGVTGLIVGVVMGGVGGILCGEVCAGLLIISGKL
eukprot:8409661-Ditylum_brightwellii.AAC.1